jgi:hypothetical protein
MPPTPDTLRERLASQAHESWGGWMHYIISKCYKSALTGALTLPDTLVERWTRQMATPYADLSPEEQESDRMEADKYLKLFEEFLAPSEGIGDTGDATASK